MRKFRFLTSMLIACLLAGLTPLAHAVQSQQMHAVKRLVKMGADVDSQDASGRTSLAMAAYQVCLFSASSS